MENKIQQATSAKNKEGKSLQAYIKTMEPAIKAALPSVMTPERFTRITLSAVSANPVLASTTPTSFLGAMMQAAQLGLEPNTPLGQAYLIPFKNNKKGGILECQFQLGYKGLIDLAYRSGDVKIIQAHVVHEGDTFEFAYGLEPELKHIPAKTNRGAPLFVYGAFCTKDGGLGFEVMTMEEVKEHAGTYSKAYSNGPWQTNFEEMAKKTVLKKALKYAPLKSDFVRALAQDETVKTELNADMSIIPSEDYEVVDDAPAVDAETGEVISTPQA